MRCRKHVTDVSSIIGVCASCLRERLIPLLAIQSPPLIFPRSVSPQRHPNRPFFSTPQLHHTTNNNNNNNNTYNTYKKSTRFSLLPKFLRSNSATSSTWISTFFSKKSSSSSSTAPAAEEATTVEILSCRRHRGRGMSPARVSDCGGDDVFDGIESIRGTPARRTPGGRRGGGGGGSQNNVSAFCLSPLVRPSPKRRGGAEMVMPPLGVAAGYCANRSRKMADFGRLQRRQ